MSTRTEFVNSIIAEALLRKVNEALTGQLPEGVQVVLEADDKEEAFGILAVDQHGHIQHVVESTVGFGISDGEQRRWILNILDGIAAGARLTAKYK
ncbi:hypothetical protein IC617_11270 [Neiella sp. HB171785]|uniref:Uncharacterized protein n=1 Tax=Neiella litorisoli TaxID=2771431 RepID=A0A8J6R372_9GAMM|nr:hypothetical protein [Neiella litorisoli]MBD1390010.1 hypothetical protein [Neiella litorisoli]